MRLLLCTAISLFALDVGAQTEPARVRGGTIRVRLGGRSERGTGLRPSGHSWLLELTGAGNTEIELKDVTKGASSMKWTVLLNQDRAELDDTRFIPGHAYRIQVRKGMMEQSGLVYLYPPQSSKRTEIQFEDTTKISPSASNDDGIATVPKNSL